MSDSVNLIVLSPVAEVPEVTVKLFPENVF